MQPCSPFPGAWGDGGRQQNEAAAGAQPRCVGMAADWEQPSSKELPKVARIDAVPNRTSRSGAALQSGESRAGAQGSALLHPGLHCSHGSPFPHAARLRPSPEPAIPACVPNPDIKAGLLPIAQPVRPAPTQHGLSTALLGEVLISCTAASRPGMLCTASHTRGIAPERGQGG